MEAFEDSLPLDEEGDLILPMNGEEGYQFWHANIAEIYDRVKAVQELARKLW